MKNTISGKVDITINLNKLVDVEVRDERGITKLVIPLDTNHIVLTESGGVFLDMIAFPTRDNKFGSSHAIKQYMPQNLRTKTTHGLIMGSIYPHGKLRYNDEQRAQKASKRLSKEKEKQRKQKYEGLDF